VLLGFLGLPSLHRIIEAVADGFFGALATALVPGFLKHGTVATIQHLVALPDPGAWTHVGQLQSEMTYLAVMLMPVTLAVGTLRYWLLGLTGQAHPVTAVPRCAAATGVLVAYPWIVAQTVAATNTLTHTILGFPAVGGGLQRIISVLFGGALLSGAGGVFGAFLVIIGVVFAAGLFAAQVLLTLILALLIVSGPPLIALSAIPELSHLSRTWAHALLATALVPLGWTVLFATAGALCLDATSFTGGNGGLPGHVAAAFAGLIMFVLAVRLPFILLGEARRHLTGNGSSRSGAGAPPASQVPGVQRVKAAHARLRSAALDGGPSLGRSVGRAAGALGAPVGGPLGAAHRGLAGAARRAGILPAAAAGAGAGAAAERGPRPERPGPRERLKRAAVILRGAPREARAAMSAATRNTKHVPQRPGAGTPSAPRPGGRAAGRSTPGPAPNPPRTTGERRAARTQSVQASGPRKPSGDAPAVRRATPPAPSRPSPRAQTPRPTPRPAVSTAPRANAPTPPPADRPHPGREVPQGAPADAAGPAAPPDTRPEQQRARHPKPPGPPRPPHAPTTPPAMARKPRARHKP
jgi:hypothetical protein